MNPKAPASPSMPKMSMAGDTMKMKTVKKRGVKKLDKMSSPQPPFPKTGPMAGTLGGL